VFGIFAAQALIQGIGWRGACLVFGLALWAMMVPAFAILMRRTPEDMGLLPDGAVAMPATDSTDSETQNLSKTEVDWPLRRVQRAPVMWMLVVTVGINQFVGSGTLVHRVGSFETDGLSDGLIGVGIAVEPLTFVLCSVWSLSVPCLGASARWGLRL
jgi:hypothetical protein